MLIMDGPISQTDKSTIWDKSHMHKTENISLADKFQSAENPPMDRSELQHTVVDRMTALMQARGFSPFTLNKAAGLNDVVRSILNGRSHSPTIGSLMRISDALGVSVMDLVEPPSEGAQGKIAARLKKLRFAINASEAVFAEAMGVGIETYRLYEKGLIRIPLETASGLSAAYGVSLDYLFLNRRDTLPSHLREALESPAAVLAEGEQR